MKILIFGGTTEGRILAEKSCKIGMDVTVSVATELGQEQLKGIPCTVLCGRLTSDGMEKVISMYDIVADATHPYAREASENIRAACEKTNKPLRRILRSASGENGCIMVSSAEEAAEELKNTEGNILLTTGSKELRMFSGIAPDRLFPRILPLHDSLSICEETGIPHKNIIAMQGPFTKEMNVALIRQFNIKWLVTKNSGTSGGTDEKLQAADETGAKVIMISRSNEDGITMDAFLRELEEGANVND